MGTRELFAVAVRALHRPRSGWWVQPGQRCLDLGWRARIVACPIGQAQASAAQDRPDHGRAPLGSGEGSPTARLCRVM